MPPQIDEQTIPNAYRSYSENQYGEQAIFLYEYWRERGTPYKGDAGWEHLFDVVDGKVPKLVLNRPEQIRIYRTIPSYTDAERCDGQRR